jgi:glycosyltransferase involved in cell wall biosynthesis
MDVINGLAANGHDCSVLTSTFGISRPVSEGGIHRLLELEKSEPKDFLERYRRTRHNQTILREIISIAKPEIIFIWNMGYLNWTLLRIAEEMCPNVAYFFSDLWVVDKYRIPTTNLFKLLIDIRYAFKQLKLSHVACSCQYLKDELLQRNVPVRTASVIYNAVSLDDYLRIDRISCQKRGGILYVGRLEERKGVHTLLKAFGQIAVNRGLSLTIVGTGEEEYLAFLKSIVNEFNIESLVTFTGQVPREELAAVFASHDIFVFPSEWEEPFSLTLIMALASGIPVIGTLTGGSKEILRPGINGLTYVPGDYYGLAEQIERLLTDADLWEHLTLQARQDVQQFSLATMVDHVEKFLLETYYGQELP